MVSPDNDVTITNDGATILNMMDVDHQVRRKALTVANWSTHLIKQNQRIIICDDLALELEEPLILWF